MKIKKLSFLFSVAIAVILLISATLLTASAEEIAYPIEGGFLYFDTDTATVTGVSQGVTVLDIPESINGIEVTQIKRFAFGRENSLSVTQINIPSTVLVIGDGAFFGNRTLQSINVDPENPVYCDIDGVLFDKNKTTLMSYPNAKPITEYAVPEGVTILDTYAFVDTRNLKVLDLRSIKIARTESLAGIHIESLIFDSNPLTVEKHTVLHDRDLDLTVSIKRVYFTGDKTGNWYGAVSSFCKRFSYNFDGVVDIIYPINNGHIFFKPNTGTITGGHSYNSNTNNLDIPEEINGIKVVAIADNALSFSSAGIRFNRLTIPGTVKTIGNNAFNNAPIAELIIGDGVEYIGDYAFESANNLTELAIPESVKRIGTGAFYECAWLEYVTYYSNTFIPEGAFDACAKYIKIVVLESTAPAVAGVSSEGLNLTVHNLDGVKDYFIAKGNYATYRELKPYYLMRVTAKRIDGANEYTYTLKEPGEYTVCVRFEDGSEDLFLYHTVSVTLPKFAIDELNVTVSNLNDIRVIRTAAGEWNSPGEVKRAPGCRNITANTIGGKNSYTINYKEDGVYTVTLEYYNGLVVVEHIELTRTVPTFTQEGNKVIIGNLDDLYTIRFAKGEYSTMGEIKRAEGCQIRRSRDIQNGVITVKHLDPGTYTFCVQYNDNSYHYYTAVVE